MSILFGKFPDIGGILTHIDRLDNLLMLSEHTIEHNEKKFKECFEDFTVWDSELSQRELITLVKKFIVTLSSFEQEGIALQQKVGQSPKEISEKEEYIRDILLYISIKLRTIQRLRTLCQSFINSPMVSSYQPTKAQTSSHPFSNRLHLQRRHSIHSYSPTKKPPESKAAIDKPNKSQKNIRSVFDLERILKMIEQNHRFKHRKRHARRQTIHTSSPTKGSGSNTRHTMIGTHTHTHHGHHEHVMTLRPELRYDLNKIFVNLERQLPKPNIPTPQVTIPKPEAAKSGPPIPRPNIPKPEEKHIKDKQHSQKPHNNQGNLSLASKHLENGFQNGQRSSHNHQLQPVKQVNPKYAQFARLDQYPKYTQYNHQPDHLTTSPALLFDSGPDTSPTISCDSREAINVSKPGKNVQGTGINVPIKNANGIAQTYIRQNQLNERSIKTKAHVKPTKIGEIRSSSLKGTRSRRKGSEKGKDKENEAPRRNSVWSILAIGEGETNSGLANAKPTGQNPKGRANSARGTRPLTRVSSDSRINQFSSRRKKKVEPNDKAKQRLARITGKADGKEGADNPQGNSDKIIESTRARLRASIQAEADQQIQDLKLQHEDHVSELSAQFTSKMKGLLAQHEQVQSQLSSSLSQVNSENSSLKQRLQQQSAKIKDLEEQIHALNDQIQRSEEQCIALNAQVKSTEQQKEEIQQILQQTKAELQSVLLLKEQVTRESKEQIEAHKATIQTHQTTIQQHQQKITTMDTQAQEVKSQNESKLKEYEAKIKEHAGSINMLVDELDKLEAELTEARSKRSEAEQLLVDLTEENTRVNQRLTQLRDAQRRQRAGSLPGTLGTLTGFDMFKEKQSQSGANKGTLSTPGSRSTSPTRDLSSQIVSATNGIAAANGSATNGSPANGTSEPSQIKPTEQQPMTSNGVPVTKQPSGNAVNASSSVVTGQMQAQGPQTALTSKIPHVHALVQAFEDTQSPKTGPTGQPIQASQMVATGQDQKTNVTKIGTAPGQTSGPVPSQGKGSAAALGTGHSTGDKSDVTYKVKTASKAKKP